MSGVQLPSDKQPGMPPSTMPPGGGQRQQPFGIGGQASAGLPLNSLAASVLARAGVAKSEKAKPVVDPPVAEAPPTDAAPEPAADAAVQSEAAPTNAAASVSIPGLPDDVLGLDAPAEAPATPPAEPAVIPPPEEIKSNPKSAHAWALRDRKEKELEAKLAEAEAARKRLEEERARLEQEYKTAKQSADELSARFEQVSLAESPVFKAKYDTKFTAIRAELNQLLASQGLPADEAAKKADVILAATPESYGALFEGFPTYVQGALFNKVNEFHSAREARKQELKDWRATKTALEAKKAQESRIRLSYELDADVEKAVSAAAAAGNPLFRTSAKDEAHNKEVVKRVDAFRALVKNLDNRADILRYVADGASAPYYLNTIRDMAKRMREMTTEIEELRNANPSYRPAQPAAKPATRTDAVPKTANVADVVTKVMSPLFRRG